MARPKAKVGLSRPYRSKALGKKEFHNIYVLFNTIFFNFAYYEYVPYQLLFARKY